MAVFSSVLWSSHSCELGRALAGQFWYGSFRLLYLEGAFFSGSSRPARHSPRRRQIWCHLATAFRSGSRPPCNGRGILRSGSDFHPIPSTFSVSATLGGYTSGFCCPSWRTTSAYPDSAGMRPLISASGVVGRQGNVALPPLTLPRPNRKLYLHDELLCRT